MLRLQRLKMRRGLPPLRVSLRSGGETTVILESVEEIERMRKANKILLFMQI
jgi:hypothetical protein